LFNLINNIYKQALNISIDFIDQSLKVLMIINPQRLPGPWKAGFALDLHTLSSVPKEWTTKKVTEIVLIAGKPVTIENEIQDKVTKWDTTYSAIGLEMNHLKYWGEIHRAEAIGTTAADFLKQQQPSWNINLIIPIPPSDTTREFQPVYEIVNRVGSLCTLPIDFHSLKKLKSTSELKRIDEPIKRKELLNGAFSIQNSSLTGKNILLFDDLYRSGETLNAVCDIITNQGKANNVYVLTITRTRSKR
jgi:competence protein ComFC